MKKSHPGKELEIICFFHEVPVKGKIVLLSVEGELLVWKTSSEILALISYTGELFTNIEKGLIRFEVVSIDDREMSFTTKEPVPFNEEIFKRQIL
jgi:hypothetical protein